MTKFETDVSEATPQSSGDFENERPEVIPERDLSVLRLIGDEELTGFTFDGLKRRLGAHSETLSRTLDRLESEGIIEKGEQGYRVTLRGRDYANFHPLSISEERLTLLRTLLPYDGNPRDIATSLKGRWFGMLRWLGYSESEDGITLKWVTEDGGIQIEAKFSPSELLVEGKLRNGKNLADAIRAAHYLMGYVAKASPRPAPFRRVALMQVVYQSSLPN